MATKKWTYATFYSYKDKDGIERTMNSQLYQIGVYVILDSNPTMQFGTTPADMVKAQKLVQKDKTITDLKIENVITVIEENGFFKKLEK